MSDLSAFLNEQMNNPEFAQEYNAVQPEMDAIRSMINGKCAATPYHSATKANCRQHEYDLKN